MITGVLRVDLEDQYPRARGRGVGNYTFQAPGVIHVLTLGDGGDGEQTSEQEMGADAPCEEIHHYGATAAHMQIAEQCGTVGPAGQSALCRPPLRRLFLMNIEESAIRGRGYVRSA